MRIVLALQDKFSGDWLYNNANILNIIKPHTKVAKISKLYITLMTHNLKRFLNVQ